MLSIDQQWQAFACGNSYVSKTEKVPITIQNVDIPDASPLHLCTKTIIAYINFQKRINLETLFWKIPIHSYYEPKEGIIKKQIQITCKTNEHLEEVKREYDNVSMRKNSYVIMNVEKKDKLCSFKHIQKIDIGTSKVDVLSTRKKKIKQKAFYNCFTMVFRVYHKEKEEYKEIHVKLFNTGKLEIPGITQDSVLFHTLDLLISYIKPYITNETIPLSYSKDIENVLINMKFHAGFNIRREVMYEIMRNKYNIIASYESTGYPGVKCKFYYNKYKDEQDGRCNCESLCEKSKAKYDDTKCKEISFMIFRTGNILILGHSNIEIFYKIYDFLKYILKTEFHLIHDDHVNNIPDKKPTGMIRKKTIFMLGDAS